ncbi:tyrosine-type recombinase/integrase [Sulfitobacter aestuariivivens]|uniref:Integrase arm-type DNA-binding domain-containing protein n=1 Tax=Sulfitobacter aestuariivivens TaxID=2766981 RepID=A0A927D9F2_9RHOB|nr:integrase arm-type DNA-binding domain-containing protein [Sulfitobacter aestuariivivens]MBD3666179.1 integrase arm-type DNA-binding domain-containing protein [Sulfitobacter aestuariivivens]
MALTDTAIRNTQPRVKPFKISDSHGLYLLVNPRGSRLWRFKYRYNGREKLLSLGSYPLVGLKHAREKRDEARLLLTDGYDPSAEKQKRRRQEFLEQGISFSEIAREYVEKLRREGRAAQTLRKLDWLITLAEPHLGTFDVKEIEAQDVLVVLRSVEAESKFETATRLRSTIGAIIRYAIATGRATQDPTLALKGAIVRPRKQHRSAILNKRGLGGLLNSIDTYSGEPKTGIALQLLALLAPRPGELRLAKWEEFELEDRVWRVPEERTKMRRPHRAPLSRQALACLKELDLYRGKSNLLFPSGRNWRKAISENTLNQALRRMGYNRDEMTAHGFRASFSTLANEAGQWQSDAIERALGHVEGNDVRRAYARGEHWEERVELSQWWADELDSYRELARDDV